MKKIFYKGKHISLQEMLSLTFYVVHKNSWIFIDQGEKIKINFPLPRQSPVNLIPRPILRPKMVDLIKKTNSVLEK